MIKDGSDSNGFIGYKINIFIATIAESNFEESLISIITYYYNLILSPNLYVLSNNSTYIHCLK
jgi:hypothetical protein